MAYKLFFLIMIMSGSAHAGILLNCKSVKAHSFTGSNPGEAHYEVKAYASLLPKKPAPTRRRYSMGILKHGPYTSKWTHEYSDPWSMRRNEKGLLALTIPWIDQENRLELVTKDRRNYVGTLNLYGGEIPDIKMRCVGLEK